MVKSWYINDDSLIANDEQKRGERHLNPPRYLNLDELKRKTGVTFNQANPETYKTEGIIADIVAQRGNMYFDILDFDPERMDGYSDKIAAFYKEHLHAEDEVRLVLEGSGYFDLRDADNRWIRIAVKTGDVITVPAGSYHRFVLDENNYVKLFRLFGEHQDKWKAHNRPADQLPERINWLEKAVNGF